jgi:hypothetical protein
VISSDFFLPELHAVPILALRRPDAERPAADEVLDSLSFAPRLIVEIAGGDHGTFSDDPVQRLVLDTDTEAHADTHSQMARVARAFLAEALREGAAPFDGGSLGRRLEQQGVTVRFRAPVEPNPDAEPIPDPESVP